MPTQQKKEKTNPAMPPFFPLSEKKREREREREMLFVKKKKRVQAPRVPESSLTSVLARPAVA